LKTLDLFMRGAKGNDGHATSPLDERSHNVSLYTAIEDYDVRPSAFNSLWFWGRDLSDDVALPWEGCLSGASDKILVVSSSGVLDDHSSGVADISDVQSQRTRIDPCDRWNAVAFEEFVDRPGRSSVTGRLGKLSYDEARDPGPSRFVRVVVDPIIANQGICHTDDLATERGVGCDLLVANHRRGKHHFALCVDCCAETLPAKHPPICQRQCRISERRVPRTLTIC
jgi:hypothetical protein